MKKIILLFFVFLTSHLYAQSVTPEEIDRFRYDMRGSFRANDDKIEATKKLVEAASRIAKNNNIDHTILSLTNERSGEKFLALEILPSFSSLANKEALRLEREFGGLKLIFSPHELKRGMNGTNAFFVPSGERIGVPTDFLFNQITESYLHELGHATTYLKLIKGLDDTYAGVLQVTQGWQMSRLNGAGYARFSSLDELKTTLLSASLSTKELYSIYKTYTDRRAFNNNRELEEKLSGILFSLDNAYNLARQTHDIAKRSIEHLQKNEFKRNLEMIRLGDKLAAKVYAFSILSTSYESQTALRFTEFKEGAVFKFYALDKNVSTLIKRLEKIVKETEVLIPETNRLRKLIGVRIQYADLASTDMEVLARELADRFSM